MEFSSSFILLFCSICAFFFILTSTLTRRRSGKPLPPGPSPLPIIGNLLNLGQNPHISLTKLSKTYGPLMHLKLGTINAIVVSSPDLAKEILQKHDQAFPLRTTVTATQVHDHHKSSVACLHTGSKWRNLRKICKEQMFSTPRLEASRDLRREKLRKLNQYVNQRAINGGAVDIGEAAFVTSLNLLSSTLFSLDFADYDSGSSQEMKEIVNGYMRIIATPNVADYFPVLGNLDPQGIKKEAEFYFGKLLKIFDDIVVKRMESRSESCAVKNDLLEALLGICEEDESELKLSDIKHLLLDLFVAGTDTTSGTVEWVMAELIRNPDIMIKVKAELGSIIGQNKQVEESDISSLPYLRAVIKESFRYHPPGPFILRRKDDEDLEIFGTYRIPKNALILINLWSMGRDPNIWSNPDSFDPDRYLDGEIDFKGQNFQLIPFGAGRRMCPGVPLAYRMVHVLAASLIHNFDWEVVGGREKVDVNEKFGMSLQKAVPLKAIPIKV